MGNKQVVLAIFADEAAADAAAESLKSWDKVSNDVKLNAIGVLVSDDKGQIKAHKLGRRSVGKGAGIGLILALATPVGMGAMVVGGVFGALHHKGLGLKEEDRERLAGELAGGKAAVGVLAPANEAAAISAKLVELGGAAEVLDVSDVALDEADAAVAAEPEAPAAGA